MWSAGQAALRRGVRGVATAAQGPPRVRFAPSPTGYLHLGGLRTALFNYLFAKRHGGSMILRIEDTDQTRLVDGSIQQIIESLSWAGIEFDEGPGKESSVGPFIQSQRLPLYRAAADQLVEEGHAYPCFCSSERLSALRESQAARGVATMYDRACASIPPAEAAARVAGGESHVVRMRVPSGTSPVSDAVVGDVTFPHAAVDDQVLLKSDGWPTYHLACVVDDAGMGVTHVIRGQEWLSSTPKHQLLHAALGTPVPTWVHLPLLVNPDRTKLSKRQGHVSVGDFRDTGVLPEALVNFSALLGWHAGEGVTSEVFAMEELVELFSLEGLNKANCVVDRSKLAWFNAQHLRRAVAAAGDAPVAPALVEVARCALPSVSSAVRSAMGDGRGRSMGWAIASGGVEDAVQAWKAGALQGDTLVQIGEQQVPWEYVQGVLKLHHERVSLTAEYGAIGWSMFARPDVACAEVAEMLQRVSTQHTQQMLVDVLQAWKELPESAWTEVGVPQVMGALKQVCKTAGCKQSAVMKPIRVILTAAEKGSAMSDLLAVMAQDEVCERLAAALEAWPAPGPQH